MTQTIENPRASLSGIERQMKFLKSEKRNILRNFSDPEKNNELFKIVKKIYMLVLETKNTDELNLRAFMQNILSHLNEDELKFYIAHKHDDFYRHKKLLAFFKNDENQKSLKKLRYINIHYFNINTLSTPHQIFYYTAQAKIYQHRDIQLEELKSLKLKEELRNTLFDKERFNQITDYNERECLLVLLSHPQLKNKELIQKSKIPRSNWYRYKSKFHELKIL